MSVIHLQRDVYIIALSTGLHACEVSTHGINKPNETFEEYCERMEYHECVAEPNFPVPAIPLRVVWPVDGYVGMIYIDALNYGEDDPYIACCWDFYGPNDDEWHGKYQPCYSDKQAEFYRMHGAWGKGA